jgi:hypothetical protein
VHNIRICKDFPGGNCWRISLGNRVYLVDFSLRQTVARYGEMPFLSARSRSSSAGFAMKSDFWIAKSTKEGT